MDVFLGRFIHCSNFGEIEIFENTVIAVKNGIIVAINTKGDLERVLKDTNFSKDEIRNTYILNPNQFIIPGLIDAHIHAPQFENTGIGYDVTLLDWLQKFTFPVERKFENINYANEIYSKVVETTLKNGTTTAAYFGTIHVDSCIKLANVVNDKGQRCLIGKVNMNMNAPKYLMESTRKSIEDTQKFIEEINKMKNPLISAVITPRFAISCSNELMEELGKLREQYNCHVQTHVAENKDEIKLVKDLFPDSRHYTNVYEAANLLSDKTFLAHGVHLTDEELEIIHKYSSSIIHCPASNTSLMSGFCNVRRLLSAGIKVGLGTDVSGGYSPSILDAMRRALDVSIIIFTYYPNYKPLDFKEVFYLATLGGAAALALDEKIGNFKVGKDFDALVIDMNLTFSREFTPTEILQKFIYTGDDRNIKKVFVAGNLCFSR